MVQIDQTHDARRESWVESANGHPDFPVQNLPFGVFRTGTRAPAIGVAIGADILDLAAVVDAGLLDGAALVAARAALGSTLNSYMGLPASDRLALRQALSDLLSRGSAASGAAVLVSQAACTMCLPATIGDYTDFFAGIHHARNAGRRLRGPDDPLWPNYLYVPIAYHGRSSSIEVSGAEVPRPNGQRIVAAGSAPTFGPCRWLDYEFEFGVWLGGGNARGQNIPISGAQDHIVGFCLLNDWSARDIQMWESQPLGPFLAKNFATTVSPWVITVEALAPFFRPVPPRPEGYPEPLDYLRDAADQRAGALDVTLDAFLETEKTRAASAQPHRLSAANTLDLYWTFAQMVAHHSSGGCPLRAGDLFGSGTISGPTQDGFGSLFELTDAGEKPLRFEGEERIFLEEGDEVILRGHCSAPDFVTIGFGECRGRVVPNTVNDIP